MDNCNRGVNNAGGAHGLDPVASAKDADWEAMFESNVLGLLRVTRSLLPLLTSTPGSYILNIGSVAGRTAYEGGAAYCAAKAGELQITRALRLELCGTGVRVSTIDPGLAETEFSLVRFKGDEDKAAAVYHGVEAMRPEDIADWRRAALVPEGRRLFTGLTVRDFDLLVRLKVFNTEQMNQAVFAFRRYEDASLRYTGIESHQGLSHYGLYDTVVARD